MCERRLGTFCRCIEGLIFIYVDTHTLPTELAKHTGPNLEAPQFLHWSCSFSWCLSDNRTLSWEGQCKELSGYK